MPTIVVNYTCGCGFKTIDGEKAVKHSEEKKHTVSVNGEIRKDC